jgi:penicillin-binding protein 2
MPVRKIIRIFKRRIAYTDVEIFPDEIFLDSRNLPQYDVHQFEGRLEKPISRVTIIAAGVFFILIAAAFSSRAFFLQVNKGEVFAAQSEQNRLNHTAIFANRGIIYDRRGTELAANAVADDGRDYALRTYTPMPGLAHILGYVKYPSKDSSGFYYQTEYVGKDGVEKMFNDTLTGVNGVRIVETDARNSVKSQSMVEAPKDGQNLTLALDAEMTSKLHESIQSVAQEYGFRGGAGVIMDVRTGEILTLTSFPEFSPDTMTQGKDVAAIQSFFQNPDKPFLNRVVAGLYTPGSIVKPYMALAALSEKVIDPLTAIYSSGQIEIQNPYNPEQKTVFKDWRAQGWVDMREALAVSSNVYFYEISGGFEDQKGLGITKIEKYVRMLGLGEITGVDVAGEIEGVIPNPEWKKQVFNNDAWRLGDTYHTSIGQYGFQLTPIQAVRSVAAIANNGKLMEPTILLRSEADALESARIVTIAPQHFQVVREGMRRAVFTVTAARLDVPYVEVAAKSGTAELGTAKLLVNSWVTGFWPAQEPKYAFAIIMERGSKFNQLGATYVMRQLLDWMNENRQEYF